MNESKSLDELAIKYQTDKASIIQCGIGHGYARYYDRLFSPLRHAKIKLLEIGVGSGPSIQMWLDYFPHAWIYGVDKVSGTNEWNTVGQSPNPRYIFVTGDQTDETFWKCFAVDYGVNWDIIIDDGGHFNNQIIISFQGLWPILKQGGLYCIEDLGVCYGSGSIFVVPGWKNHMDFIKDKLDQINLNNEVDWMHFSKELAIICKK